MFRFTRWHSQQETPDLFSNWRAWFSSLGMSWEVRRKGHNYALFLDGEDATRVTHAGHQIYPPESLADTFVVASSSESQGE